MKLIATLIKNEYIKLFKKKSVPILLFVLLLFIFGISLIKPFNYGFIGRDFYSPSYFENEKLQYKYNIENSVYEYFGEKEDISDEIKAVIKEFYEKQIALCDKAIAILDESENDWRISAITELLNMSVPQYLSDYATGNGEYAEEVNEYLSKIGYFYGYERYLSYSAQFKAIMENDYSESKRYLYDLAVKTSDSLKAQLDELKSKKENGAGGSDIDFKFFKVNGRYINSERIVRAYKAALDKKIEYNSVLDETLRRTINALQSAMFGYESILSEEEFQKSKENDTNNYYYYSGYYYGYNSNDTYEDYLENSKKSIENDENKGLVGLYSLENDVTEMSLANSARDKSLSFINLFWFIAPLAIYFASSMVSQEFSTKTINLLLIRPVKRWKILLSKYICIVTLTLGMIVACAAVYLVGTGISFGFSDFLQPYIYIASGEAHAASFVPWFLWRVFLAAVPVFCLVNLTFMFSTVTKGTAVSLILGVLSLFSSILILFFTGLFENPDIITYMPFPYFSMWSYVLSDIIYLDGSNGNIFSYLINADLTYGFILMLGFIILSVILAFADFTKKDIK